MTEIGTYGESKQATESNDFVPHILPFDASILENVEQQLFVHTEEQASVLNRIKEENKQRFENAPVITVVADGRLGRTGQGWIGDMIEATRLVEPLLHAGKQVKLVTSEPSLAAGYTGNDVQIIPIPSEIPGIPLHPWNEQMLEFLGKQSEGSPVLFPINAHMPVLVQLDAKGMIVNADIIHQIPILTKQHTHGEGISVRWWADHHVHQLQALQIIADFVGFSQSIRGGQFPASFIHPDVQSVCTADAVIGLYNCLPERILAEESPVFFHPGVATDNGKTEKKFYSEVKWQQVIDAISRNGSGENIHPLIFLTPTNINQAKMTKRLASYAQEKNIQTIQVPLIEVQQKFGWSLGSFAFFLHRLSEQRGIIVGVDSMPAGHLGPALGMPSLVLGNKYYPPEFFSPPDNARVILPRLGKATNDIEPNDVAIGIKTMVGAAREVS